MSRKLTRKSVALGAGISLLASGLFAAPAFAAAGVESDSQGTAGVFGMVAGTPFKLLVNGNSEFPAGNAALLRIHIKNMNGKTASEFKFSTTNSTDVSVDGTYNSVDSNGVTPGDELDEGNLIITGAGATKTSTDATLAATVDAVAVMGLGASTNGTGDAPDSESVSVMTSPFTFSFTSDATAGTPAVYEVTAFVDTNNNAVMDAGEMKAPTRNVTFYNLADLTSTLTIDPMLEGDTQITGHAVINNVDMAQIAPARTGVWLEDINGTAIGHGDANLIIRGTANTDGAASEVQYSSTNKRFQFKTAAATGNQTVNSVQTGLKTALVAGKSVRGNFLLDARGDTAAAVGDKITTTGSGTIAARTSGSIVVDTVDSETTATVTAAASVTANVKLNSSYAVKAVVKDTSTPAKALSGKAVTAKVTTVGATLSSSITVTVNGTKYTTNASLPGATGVARLALTTDSKGEVVVNITTAGFSNGNDVVVEFLTDNRTATITTNNATPTYTAALTNALNSVGIADGGTASLAVSVRDQFGGKPANSTYRIYSSFDSQSGQSPASTSASESFADVVNGEATLNITPNGKGAGTVTYDLFIDSLTAQGGLAGAATEFATNFVVDVRTAANLAIGTLTVDGGATQDATTKVYNLAISGTAADLYLADMFAHNSLTSIVDAPAPGDSATGATVTGTVSTTGSAVGAAVPIPGASVTLSGSGLLFKTIDQNSVVRYSVGSITVRTNASGTYSVVVFSNRAGKQTVSISAGSQSASVVLNAFDDADVDTGDSITFSAPKSIKGGRNLVMTVALADEWGNPVSIDTAAKARIAMSYDGPGFLISEPEVLVNGKATFRVLLGVGETGPAVLSVSYTNNVAGNVSTAAAADIISATSATWVGPIANAKAGAKAGNVVVEAYRAVGKTVKVFVGGTLRATFVADRANDSMVVRGIKSGTRNVRVTLSGPGEDFRGAVTVK